MLIILVVSLFAAAGLATLTKKMYTFVDTMYEDINYKEGLQSEIDALKNDLNTNSEVYDQATKNQIQALIDTNQLAIDNDVNIYTSYWKSDLLQQDILKSKENIYNYQSLNDQELLQKEQVILDKKIEMLKNNDFSGYINSEKELLKSKYEAGIIY